MKLSNEDADQSMEIVTGDIATFEKLTTGGPVRLIFLNISSQFESKG